MIDPRKPLTTRRQDLHRPPTAPTDDTPTLLWVNRNANTSLLVNDKARQHSASLLQRHVQRNGAERKRREKQIALGVVSARSLVDRRLLLGSERLDPSNDTQVESDEETRLIFCSVRPESVVDPFGSFSVPINEDVHTVFQYLLSVNRTVKAEQEVPTEQARELQLQDQNRQIQQLVRECLDNQRHMYVMLAQMSGHMIKVTGCNMIRENRARYYMYKATQQLRIYFTATTSPVVDARVLLDLNLIARVEWYFHNYDAATTHLRFIALHIDKLDPAKNVTDAMIANVCSHTDVLIATETFRGPILAPPPDPGRFPPGSKVEPQREKGTGLAAALSSGEFGQRVGPIIADIIPLSQFLHLRKTPAALPTDREWMCSEVLLLLHRLLSVQHSDSPFPLEEGCRIVSVILLMYVTSQIARRVGQLNAVRLKTVCRNIFRISDQSANDEIILWLLCTGMFAASDDTKTANWFAARAAKAAVSLRVRSYGQLKGVLDRFFCLEDLQEETLRTLVSVIELEYPYD